MAWNFYKCNTTLYEVFVNEPLEQCAFSFNKCWFSCHKTLIGRLKNQVQSWVIPQKSGRGRLREFFFAKFKSAQFRTGLQRSDHNQSRSLTWSWVIARRSFPCIFELCFYIGGMRGESRLWIQWMAFLVQTSPSCIQLFICLDVLVLCIFNSIPNIFFVAESKNKLCPLCLSLRNW